MQDPRDDDTNASAESALPLMQLSGLRKSFAKGNREPLVALQDIDLTIGREHHLVALIGPDGSGKSTLLQIMAGLLIPDSGTYALQLSSDAGSGGTISPKLQLIDSSDIGYMSQTLGLYEDISVWENIKLFSQLRDLKLHKLRHGEAEPNTATSTNMPQAKGQEQKSWWSRLWAKGKALCGADAEQSGDSGAADDAELTRYLEELLTQVGLIKFKDYKAGNLSGGMKQKLALTCALSAKPKLLLLDEPTVGVDPISRLELWAIIHDYLEESQGYCIFSSLYLEEAERSSLTIFIKEGRIIYTGDAATLKQQVKEQCFALQPKANLSYQKLARALMINLAESTVIRDICPRMGRIDLLTVDQQVTATELNADIQALFERSKLHISPQDYELRRREPILEDAYINLTGSIAARSDHNTAASNTTAATASAGATAAGAPAPAPQAEGMEALEEAHGMDVAAGASGGAEPAVVIDVQNIRKDFGDFTAVHDSNFKVYQGEIFGLLGPNGAGKTTTFRMICALLNPSAGKILIKGLSLAHAKSSVRATIGYVAQKFCLYRKMTLRQNLSYFGKSYGLRGELLEERMAEMCQTFALTPFLDESAENLPFGVQRSLSMACALIHKPSILFLDEATSGADPTSRRIFWQMIAELSAQGTTIIVTTHFMEEAEYCDRFLIQDQGKILILGTPDEICTVGHGHSAAQTQLEGDSISTERPEGSDRISIEEAFIACVRGKRHALDHGEAHHGTT